MTCMDMSKLQGICTADRKQCELQIYMLGHVFCQVRDEIICHHPLQVSTQGEVCQRLCTSIVLCTVYRSQCDQAVAAEATQADRAARADA